MKYFLIIFVGLIVGAAAATVITMNVYRQKLDTEFSESGNAGNRMFPEYRVVIEGLPPTKPLLTDKDRRPLGGRTKLGGEPDWIQNPQIPICRECQKPMIFVAQIDSVAMLDRKNYPAKDPKTGKGIEKLMLGDVGMIYVFTCLECGEVRGVGQCH